MRVAPAFVLSLLIASPVHAQGRGEPQAPPIVSPEVHKDRTVTFRIAAADAQTVEVRTPGDIPGSINPAGRGLKPFPLTKSAAGVWETTVGPVPAGAYRYAFAVNGVTVVDPRNPQTSQTNTTVYSLVVVPGQKSSIRARCRMARWRRYCTTRRRSAAFAACTSTLLPGMRAGAIDIRCCICCTVRAMPTRRGAPLGARASSSTT